MSTYQLTTINDNVINVEADRYMWGENTIRFVTLDDDGHPRLVGEVAQREVLSVHLVEPESLPETEQPVVPRAPSEFFDAISTIDMDKVMETANEIMEILLDRNPTAETDPA